jgi:hypothetical protein
VISEASGNARSIIAVSAVRAVRRPYAHRFHPGEALDLLGNRPFDNGLLDLHAQALVNPRLQPARKLGVDLVSGVNHQACMDVSP